MRRRQGLARDQRGMAVVEFALLLPTLLTLFIGSYEAASLMLADQKLEAAAETAADLVAQTVVNTVLQSSDFTNISNAVTQVMTPFDTSGTKLKIAYASITYSTGTAVIDWHKEVNSAPAISLAHLPNGATTGNLGTAATGSSDSLIVVQVTYSYSSPLSYVLNTAYTLSEAAMNRPRYVNCVATYLNTNNVCP